MKSTESVPFDIQLDPSQDNYVVFGNPVAHSKSPLIHQTFARQTAQSLIYQAILVPVNEFESAVLEFQRQGGKGLNVTVPFKEQAFKFVTSRTARAELAGAVNTVSLAHNGEVRGDNTDGTGLLEDLRQNNIPIEATRILILGAGGAVRGILGPLVEQKPDSIIIANRTLARADLLVSSFPNSVPLSSCQLNDLADTGRFDLVINAISAGLKGESPPLPATLIDSTSCCYDMVYGDAETVFVRWARQHGVRIAVDGLGMLVEQAAESFYIWRGVRPETAPVIRMLRGEG